MTFDKRATHHLYLYIVCVRVYTMKTRSPKEQYEDFEASVNLSLTENWIGINIANILKNVGRVVYGT